MRLFAPGGRKCYNIVMSALISYFDQFAWLARYFEYVASFSSRQIYVLAVIAALLMAFIFYRWFKVGGLLALLFIFLIIFTIIKVDLYGTYLERQHEEELRQKLLQREFYRNDGIYLK